MPKPLRENILFASIKNDTLLIATKHIAISAEINNFRTYDILNAIKLMLDSTHLISQNPLNENLAKDLETLRRIKKVKAYVPKNILEHKDSTESVKVMYFKERAKGDFTIDEDSPFREIFEAIKVAIKQNLANELKRQD